MRTSTASRWTSPSASPFRFTAKAKPAASKSDGGILELIMRADRSRVPAGRHSGAHRSRRDRPRNQSSACAFPILPVSAKVKILEDADQVVVHVVSVKEEVAAAPGAAAAPAEGEAAAAPSAEPEVVKKGKKEEEKRRGVDRVDRLVDRIGQSRRRIREDVSQCRFSGCRTHCRHSISVRIQGSDCGPALISEQDLVGGQSAVSGDAADLS